MHKVFDQVQAAVDIPFLHLADATADRLKRDRLDRVGLLGTRFTMEQGFYRERLEAGSNATVIVPDEEDRERVHRIIYDELCKGVLTADSRSSLAGIMGRLGDRGAQAVVLGCTELGLLVGDSDPGLPVLDTTKIHVEAALSLMGLEVDLLRTPCRRELRLPTSRKRQSRTRLDGLPRGDGHVTHAARH